MAQYREYISTAYKSLEQPDFAFVKKGFSARPYDPVIKRMRDFAAIEEATQADDDVCFSYLIKGQSSLWKLDLSLVGPFGLFVRLRSRIQTCDFLHYTSDDLTAFEYKILNVLKGAGIRLMTAPDLSIHMPMRLFNTSGDDVRLYQALFSDRDTLPWEAS